MPCWRSCARFSGTSSWAFALLAAAALVACTDGPCPDGWSQLAFSPAGPELCAEYARTETERSTGLRGHAPLAVDEALVIAFPVTGEVCIVNDGVDFAIDAVYVDEASMVTAIERGIAAGDPTARCHAPTRQVVEVAAGTADALQVGHRVALQIGQ